ncbi:MAG: hypothetical protein WA880_08025 [Ornithinimicrobium sp.]
MASLGEGDMAQMWDSGQDEEQPHRGDKHPGLQKSYHMNLADQMDQQAGGSAFPPFMRTAKGAIITVVVVLLLMTLMVMYNATFR